LLGDQALQPCLGRKQLGAAKILAVVLEQVEGDRDTSSW
jgi:hypothetical protein